MKTVNLFAVMAVILASCAATLAQTLPGAPAPAAPTPAVPSGSPSTTPSTGDSLGRPPEAPVVAHGTDTDTVRPNVVSLTNDSGADELQEVVQFNDIPLTEAVKSLALKANLNIIFDPKLLTANGPDGHPVPVTPPNIDIKWKNLTAKTALYALLNNWGWQLQSDPGSPIGRITAKDMAAPEPLLTTVVQLEYGNPTNVLAEVQPTLSVRSTIISDARTHKLIIRTTERELPSVLALISKLDTAVRQVLIEAKIIETTKDITSAKGVDWTGTLSAQHVSFGNGLTSGTIQSSSQVGTTPVTSTTTTSPGGSPINGTSGGGISTIVSNVSSLTTTIPGVPSSGGGLSLNTARGFSPATAFLNADGVSAVLAFLNTDADTKSIAFPRTVALDGEKTSLMVVQNIPVFEQQQSAPAAGASQGLATVLPNYDKVVGGTILNEVGVKLTVLPRIAGPTNVLLDLRPEISQKDALVASDTLNGQVNTAPIFDRRSIVTEASVPSGYTLVLGGLESDNVIKNFTKVPFLGDLPGLGYLFRSDSKSRTKDTILIFVTPTIIQDSDFQPGNSTFLKRKGSSPSDVEEAPWDTGKPYDWTKPKAGVAPSY